MSVPLNFSCACGTGIAWKVELSSTLPVPQADCRQYLGQVFPFKKICLGHVPGSAAGTTAGTVGTIRVIWEQGLRKLTGKLIIKSDANKR